MSRISSRTTPEICATDGPLSDEAEPAADLVEPRETGRCVVDLEAMSRGQPGAHFGMSAGGLVICDQCISRCRGTAPSMRLRKLRKSWCRCRGLTVGDHGSSSDVEGRKQDWLPIADNGDAE